MKKIHERLNALRKQLTEEAIDIFLVPHEDEFLNEYVPENTNRLQWITGFSGSAGFVIILQDKVVLFVDGRYTIQAKQQIEESDLHSFEIIHIAKKTPIQWLSENISKNTLIGYDAKIHNITFYGTLKSQSFNLQPLEENPIDRIWKRSKQTPIPVVPHHIKYSGQDSLQKRHEIAKTLQTQKTKSLFISQAENIAWLLNIRSQDIPHTPLALSFAIIYDDTKVDWFLDTSRINEQLIQHIGEDVTIHESHQLSKVLASLNNTNILLNPKTTPQYFAQYIKNPIYGVDPITLKKSHKNETELIGSKNAHIRDATSLCRFFCWLEEQTTLKDITEIQADDQLTSYRKDNLHFQSLSFDTISGTGKNGAIIHYHATQKTNQILREGQLYLIDSGGQYLDGTTDVTRTVFITGKNKKLPTKEEKKIFTLVLKGHLALANAYFPEGTNGIALDAITRLPLWNEGLDFDHGTGHGVGSYLSVHEGPQNISKAGTTPLEVGMIVSNEPGYYRENDFGIRIENLQFVKKVTKEMERPMLCFETLTLAPIDKKLIEPSLLTKFEIDQLNTYHQKVYDTLTLLLDTKTREWLKQATLPLQQV